MSNSSSSKISNANSRPTRSEASGYVQRSNLEYLESQYSAFLANPQSVGEDWKLFFEGVEFAQSLTPKSGGSLPEKELQVYDLIHAYREYGHLKADLDPLKLRSREAPSLNLTHFGLSEKDLDSEFQVGSLLGKPKAKLREIISDLESKYCGTLTLQVAECEQEVREWFHAEIEAETPTFRLSLQDKKDLLNSLTRTESMEKFLHSRYVGAKRFSIEGGDALLPTMETLVKTGVQMGMEELVIGMAHRGRLNVLGNFMGKSWEDIFSEFEGRFFSMDGYDGDVKYHMGFSRDKETPSGNCHISLAFNPSHLECVNPVVCGMARAKQRNRKDTKERKKVLTLHIHGDAAFAGQGVVMETLQMSRLKGYTVGGTIHIIINNQVGFTTNPESSRSSRYSSDAAAAIKAPVILVNGDDAEACARAADMAVRFRQKFKQDVVIDLICYRKYGHNEADEPAFTQPLMYEKIKSHPSPRQIYGEKLVREKVIAPEFVESSLQEKLVRLQEILDEIRKNPKTPNVAAFGGAWEGYRRATKEDFEVSWPTATTEAHLKKAIPVLTEVPKDFQLNPKIEKLIHARKEMIRTGSIDWAMGELLAYGSLLSEGTSVRISGQDCERGTFTHRQAVYYDAKTGATITPLDTINPEKTEFVVYNSLLSEMAVLGFEYGNSTADPKFLMIWEAQFGDFANGAQIIIDQFLSSGESKWLRCSGLVLLLPHGYEGQGPEHSSARLERFLQLCAQENMQVVNLTTPAQIFHALRRQMMRPFRKPLIVMSPKSLLRHPKVVSPLKELTEGKFLETLADPFGEDPKKADTLIFCTGKIYYDLDAARDQKKLQGKRYQIVRVEQLYPFPKAQIAAFIQSLPKLKRLVWAQEEPENMGAYPTLRYDFESLLKELGIRTLELEYVGRTRRASPATGSPYAHQKEQTEIVNRCLPT